MSKDELQAIADCGPIGLMILLVLAVAAIVFVGLVYSLIEWLFKKK